MIVLCGNLTIPYCGRFFHCFYLEERKNCATALAGHRAAILFNRDLRRRYKMYIRKAIIDDLSRVAEIYVFNNRINFFPIFKDESFSFGELQVVSLVDNYFKKDEIIKNIYVFDNGLIKGFIQMDGTEICKLYVDTSFQSEGIGNELIEFAIKELHANNLWALEKILEQFLFTKVMAFI